MEHCDIKERHSIFVYAFFVLFLSTVSDISAIAFCLS